MLESIVVASGKPSPCSNALRDLYAALDGAIAPNCASLRRISIDVTFPDPKDYRSREMKLYLAQMKRIILAFAGNTSHLREASSSLEVVVIKVWNFPHAIIDVVKGFWYPKGFDKESGSAVDEQMMTEWCSTQCGGTCRLHLPVALRLAHP